MAEPVFKPGGMTLEEAARLNPEQFPGEIVEGEFVPVPRNTWRHGVIMTNVAALLHEYKRRHGGWSVACGDPGAKLNRAPAQLRGPDVAMLRADREPAGKGVDGWVEGAPELTVEILGDSDSASDLLQKALEYLRFGGKVAWVLEPDPKRVIVVTPPNVIQLLGPEDTLDGGDLLPGFSCKVAELFE